MHPIKLLNHRSPRTLLVCILIAAAVLRLYALGSIPGSVNRDEAALGYNAYSILTTGNDEFGHRYPLTFPSFGDYKLPGYIYGSIPFIAIFGLNDFATRLLSALCGIALVYIIYALTLELTKQQKPALLAAATLAVAPWAVFYSRIAFETNVAMFLLTTAFLLLLKGMKKPWLWHLSAILIVLSLFTYNHPYMVGPILLLVFFGFHYKQLLKNYKPRQLLVPLLILLIGTLLAFQTVWSVNQAKTNVTIFKSPDILEDFWAYRRQITDNGGPFASIKLKLIGNQYVYYGIIFIENVLKNLSPNYLTIRDSNHIWNGIPGIGHFYYADYLLLLIGAITLIKSKNRFTTVLIISWVFAGIIPAASTIHQAQPNRGIMSFFILEILIALGIYRIITTKLKLAKPAILALYILNVSYFISCYFIQFPKDEKGWYPQLNQAIQSLNHQQPQSVVITPSLSESYIYYIYYSKFDPALFQQTVVRTKDAQGFYTVHSFGNIYTGPAFTQAIEDLHNLGSVGILGANQDDIFNRIGTDATFRSTQDTAFAYKIYQ